ncbi:MAG: NAD(P)/FAD-dependent oxidoreductase [Sedimentisphaerales bacterium]|nr:NAD(P)/FAD-dependent oxidoreductase [Sedimentisphaerales bacterium]
MIEKQVFIIGAGPAGLFASIFAARKGASVTILESNPGPGRKLLITGGKRCNLTHHVEPAQLIKLYGKCGKFLSFCIYQYSPDYVQDFFAQLGVNTKIEEDGCIFPTTYKAEDVNNALIQKAKSLHVKFLFNKPVLDIVKKENVFLIKTKGEQYSVEKVIIATGGVSWPQTGSTGDGYRFAKNLGHSVTEPRASLVPLITKEQWTSKLAGTSIANMKISTNLDKKTIVTQGATVFTHNGLGGPAAQDMSRYLTDFLPARKTPIGITLDLVPNLRLEEIENQIIKLTEENPKKKIENILTDFMPKRVVSVTCNLSGCNDDVPAGQLKKDIRKNIVRIIKAMPLSVIRTRPIEEATVTRGGVNLAEINSKTMESKICPGLFFAGEVINADGPCGGYSLQICWSTGALAGTCAANK